MVSDFRMLFALNGLDSIIQLVGCNGKSWNLIGNHVSRMYQEEPTCSAIDHANNIVFGTTNSGVYCSRDTGASWRRSFYQPPRPITTMYVGSLGLIYIGTQPGGNATNGGVFVSSDTGQTWKALGLYGRFISGLTTDEDGVVYASVGDVLFRSAGGIYRNVPGTTLWEDISPNHDAFGSVIYTSSGVLIAADPRVINFRSTDKGKTWLNNSISGKDPFSLISDDSGYIYAGTLGSGIYRIEGKGTSRWTNTRLGSTCDYIYSFARDNDTVFAATGCGIFRTSDRGKHWTNIGPASFNDIGYSVAVGGGGELFAGTTYGVLRCRAGDTLWRPAGLRTTKIIGVAAGGGGDLYALSEGEGVYLSTNDGKTWIDRGLARSDVLTLAISGSGDLFVGEYGGVSRSTDRGLSWQEIQIGPLNVFSFAFRGDWVYAATTDGVYYSTDGGDTWSPAGSAGMNEKFALSVAFDPEGHLYAGTYRGGVYVSSGIVTGVDRGRGIPLAEHLEQNYPNPFNPTTNIRFSVPRQSHVTLKVFDMLGREVATLANEVKPPGAYAISWDAKGVSSGLYFYRIVAGAWVETKKMLVIR